MNNSGSKPAMNLQDSFLNHVRKENLGVIIYLINGFQIRGLVRGFDNFTVIIENEGKQQLVISTLYRLFRRLLILQLCSQKSANNNVLKNSA